MSWCPSFEVCFQLEPGGDFHGVEKNTHAVQRNWVFRGKMGAHMHTHTHCRVCMAGDLQVPCFLEWLTLWWSIARPVAIYPFKPTIHGSFSLRKHGFLPYLSSLTPGYIQGSGNCGKPGQKASGGGARKTREAVKFTQGVSFCWHTRHDRYFSGCCQQNSGLCWIYVDMLSWWPWLQYIWPRDWGMAGMVYAIGRASQWMQIGGFQREAGCHWG